jgi:hypothetical protein
MASGDPHVADVNGLELLFGGSLVEQLGSQLYPSATATVAELISNAWDADAAHVWVDIPFDTWHEGGELVVIDDGHGMTLEMARDAYLVVGRKRRQASGSEESEGGRKLHGRKGIGKLAAFGTAGILECTTLRDGELTAFRLDYDAIRQRDPSEAYQVEPVVHRDPLVNPESGQPLDHGSRIVLKDLRGKRRPNQGQFLESMSRRFAVSEMETRINGATLTRFDLPVQFRFPRDGAPDGVEADGEWAVEELADGRQIRWWIGFTEKPLREEYLQGISILTHGKMAQRPFKFESAQGTTGQLGLEYLVGEFEAEWLDEGVDVDGDVIQSNRDQLQLEDERLQPLLERGRERLKWALSKRNEMRRDQAVEGFEESPALEELFAGYTSSERRRLKAIAKNAAAFPEMDEEGLLELMQQVVDSREDRVVRELMERIEAEGDDFQTRMWPLVREFGLIDARRTYSLIEARLATIDRLRRALEHGALEVPEIHEIVKRNTWLLDPRWESLGDEIDLERLVEYEPRREPGSGRFLDYLFGLAPVAPASLDQIIVVEIKRGTDSEGRINRANRDEVYKFSDYVNEVKRHYADATSEPPRIRGLMISNGYTQQGNTTRRTQEQTTDPKLEFKTWESVIEETERLHVAWLNVAQGRGRSEGIVVTEEQDGEDVPQTLDARDSQAPSS